MRASATKKTSAAKKEMSTGAGAAGILLFGGDLGDIAVCARSGGKRWDMCKAFWLLDETRLRRRTEQKVKARGLPGPSVETIRFRNQDAAQDAARFRST